LDDPEGARQSGLFRGNVSPGENGEQAVAGTATQVKKAIVAKVGLSFDQFRRAVLLAQGDFATFLKAKDAERAEILQALTGTERFEGISKAIYERNKLEVEKLGALRVKLGATVPLSEEVRAEVLDDIRRAEGICKDLEKQLAERRKQEEWFAVETARQNELQGAQARVRECLEQVESDAPRALELKWVQTVLIDAKPRRQAEQVGERQLSSAAQRSNTLREEEREMVNAWELAKGHHEAASKALREVTQYQQEAVGDIARARAVDVELNPLQEAVVVAEKEQTAANEVFSEAEKDLLRLNGELEQFRKQKQELQKRIAEVALFEPFAPDASAWMERFKAEAKILKKTQNAKREFELARNEAAQALKNLEWISGKLPVLREQRTAAEKTLGEAIRKAESFNAEEIVSKRRNAMELRDALVELRSHLETQKRVLQEQAEREALVQTLEAQVESDGVMQEELRKVKIPAAQSAFDAAQEGLRLAEFAASEQALVLRQALISGEACPVCGSCEHPNADGGNTAEKKMLAALMKGLRDKESNLQQLKADLSGLEPVLNEGKNRSRRRSAHSRTWPRGSRSLAAIRPLRASVRLFGECLVNSAMRN
jgi:DNA repair protein SbcC/Rad50